MVACHSLSCLLWFHASAAWAPELPVDRVLLAAPPDSAQIPEEGATFRLERIDAKAVLNSVSSELAIMCSGADPYNPAGAQAMYGDALSIEAIAVPGAVHITPDSGYGRWPLAEQWCLRL